MRGRLVLSGMKIIVQSLMAYVPLDDSYWLWFADFENADARQITEIWGIKPDEFWDLTQGRGRTAVQNP